LISCGRKRGVKKKKKQLKTQTRELTRHRGEGVEPGRLRVTGRELGKGERTKGRERKTRDRVAEKVMERARKKGRTKGRKRWEKG